MRTAAARAPPAGRTVVRAHDESYDEPPPRPLGWVGGCGSTRLERSRSFTHRRRERGDAVTLHVEPSPDTRIAYPFTPVPISPISGLRPPARAASQTSVDRRSFAAGC